MVEVELLSYEELTEREKENVSHNGSGPAYAGYIHVTYNGKTILLESDAMEWEDATFSRDLSWISGIIEQAYLLGLKDAGKEN